MEIHHN